MLNENNAEKPVKLIERKLAYQGKVITVYDDYVDVGGHKTHWDFIHHKGAAAVLPHHQQPPLFIHRHDSHAAGVQDHLPFGGAAVFQPHLPAFVGEYPPAGKGLPAQDHLLMRHTHSSPG